MATVRKTITLTDQQDHWIKVRVAHGGFTNDSEYIRDLIRRDEEQSPQYLKFEAAARALLEKHENENSMSDITEGVEARLRADGRLQADAEGDPHSE